MENGFPVACWDWHVKMSLVLSNLVVATGIQFCSEMFTTEEIGSLEDVKSKLFLTFYSKFSFQECHIDIWSGFEYFITRKLLWNCWPTQEWESQSYTFVWSYQRGLLYFITFVWWIWDFFPLLDIRGMLWLETEGGKDAKGAFLNVFFQECEVTLRNVTWSLCEFSDHQMNSVRAALRILCFLLSLFHTALSPTDKSELLQHHLLLMPQNLCRPDFVISVIPH